MKSKSIRRKRKPSKKSKTIRRKRNTYKMTGGEVQLLTKDPTWFYLFDNIRQFPVIKYLCEKWFKRGLTAFYDTGPGLNKDTVYLSITPHQKTDTDKFMKDEMSKLHIHIYGFTETSLLSHLKFNGVYDYSDKGRKWQITNDNEVNVFIEYAIEKMTNVLRAVEAPAAAAAAERAEPQVKAITSSSDMDNLRCLNDQPIPSSIRETFCNKWLSDGHFIYSLEENSGTSLLFSLVNSLDNLIQVYNIERVHPPILSMNHVKNGQVIENLGERRQVNRLDMMLEKMVDTLSK